jgi:TRAP-type uncharacterized transport system fused permease subunit
MMMGVEVRKGHIIIIVALNTSRHTVQLFIQINAALTRLYTFVGHMVPSSDHTTRCSILRENVYLKEGIFDIANLVILLLTFVKWSFNINIDLVGSMKTRLFQGKHSSAFFKKIIHLF